MARNKTSKLAFISDLSFTKNLGLTMAQRQALVLLDAASRLDAAADVNEFVRALEFNQRAWVALAAMGEDEAGLPRERLATLAAKVSALMGQATRSGLNDGQVEYLITLDRRVAKELCGEQCLERLRNTAQSHWDDQPSDTGLEEQLLFDLETTVAVRERSNQLFLM